jgi:hypothetical protein
MRSLPTTPLALFLLLALAAPLRGQGGSTSGTVTSLPIAFSGEVRVRAEADAPGGGQERDVFTLLRSRFGVRVDPAPSVSLFLQVQDSRVLGTEGAAPATVDLFDLHQGYAQLDGAWNASKLTLRAGRQEIALGNQRLIGTGDWSNFARSFDGARVMLTGPAAAAGAPKWDATLFGVVVNENGRRFGATAPGVTRPPDHGLFGAYGRVGAPRAAGADLVLLYDAGARYRPYVNSDRLTTDLRGWTPLPLGFRVEVEGAAQTGSQSVVLPGDVQSGQSVRGWLLAGRLQRAFGKVTPVVGADLLSGDDSPTDGTYTAFANAYGSGHPYYGLLDLIGDPAATTRERGLRDVFAMLTVAATPTFAPHAELHRFSLATGPDRDFGTEADLVAPIRITQFASLELGAALFHTGSAGVALGLGPDGTNRTWLYSQLRVAF